MQFADNNDAAKYLSHKKKTKKKKLPKQPITDVNGTFLISLVVKLSSKKIIPFSVINDKQK